MLEVISLYLFVTSNSYQRAAFFNSANAYAGVVLARRTAGDSTTSTWRA
ncbi:MAG: hypothetical protein WKG07_20710 [Hymenobacter sp.]